LRVNACSQGSSQDACCKSVSTRVPLKVVNVQEQAAIKARTTASLETILTPTGGGKVEKKFHRLRTHAIGRVRRKVDQAEDRYDTEPVNSGIRRAF
jgi:hypothetical protein